MESSSSEFTFDPAWFDTDVDPCTDFASYTSGGWKEQNPIPPSEGRWGSFNLLIEENRHRIRALLDRLEENEYPEGSYQQKIKDHYATAIDTVAIEQQGAANLSKILSPYGELLDRSDLPVVLAGMKKEVFPLRSQLMLPLMTRIPGSTSSRSVRADWAFPIATITWRKSPRMTPSVWPIPS